LIRLAKGADADLDEIAIYGLLTFGLQQAERYSAGMWKVFASLEASPGIGRREELGEGVRSFPYKAHRIDYRHDGESLVILRVLSPRQRVPDQV